MDNSTPARLPFWHVNVPEGERTQECPEGLRDLSKKAIEVIGTEDAEYKDLTWEEIKDLVAINDLGALQRRPSDLRRYCIFTHELRRKYGSVLNFLVDERLGWDRLAVPRGAPFEYDEDMKTLHNDWPYGIDERIVHLLVWTKFAFEEDPAVGDITDPVRAQIEDYVDKTFRSRMPADRVLWFRNWTSLKSVRGVEHFHVMLFDPDPAFVNEITGNDIPYSKRQPN